MNSQRSVPAALRDKKRERWLWQKDKAAGVVTRSRMANAADETRAEEVMPEELAGGGTTDKCVEVESPDDLEQDIRRQRPRYGGLRQRTCLFLSAFP